MALNANDKSRAERLQAWFPFLLNSFFAPNLWISLGLSLFHFSPWYSESALIWLSGCYDTRCFSSSFACFLMPMFYPISINGHGNGDSEELWTAHHMCVSLRLSPHSGGDLASSFLQVHLLFSVACIPLTHAGWLCLPPLRASLLPVSLFAEPDTCFFWHFSLDSFLL